MSGEFSANLKYDFQTPENAEQALKTASAEAVSSPNFTVNFSTDGQYLLATISAGSSTFLQEGLNSVYPIVEKLV